MSHWYDDLNGRPWAAVPEPPRSFTCGELCRYVLCERLGLDVPEIVASPLQAREHLAAMGKPSLFNLLPLQGGEAPREYDVVYLRRGLGLRHVGLGVASREGFKVLHCQRGPGVSLDSPADLLALGWRGLVWYRHKDLLRGVPCPR